MKTSADRALLASAASPAVTRFLRLAARARVGMMVYASLGCGRDRVVELIVDSLGEERPILFFGQSMWPPAERPTKLRADISMGVRSKSDLFGRLAQATPGATLVAASDCGLQLGDLLEASLRSGIHLVYLTWMPHGEPVDRVAFEAISAAGGGRAAQTMLAQAIPSALPIWVGVEHAPDGGFCVSRVSEISFARASVGPDGAASDLKSQDLFSFVAEGLTPERRLAGAFHASGLVPNCLEKVAEEAEETPGKLAAELFEATAVAGASGFELPGSSAEPPRARRLRAGADLSGSLGATRSLASGLASGMPSGLPAGVGSRGPFGVRSR